MIPKMLPKMTPRRVCFLVQLDSEKIMKSHFWQIPWDHVHVKQWKNTPDRLNWHPTYATLKFEGFLFACLGNPVKTCVLETVSM